MNKIYKNTRNSLKKNLQKTLQKNIKPYPNVFEQYQKVSQKNPQHQKCKYVININYLSANDVSEDIYKHPISIYQFQILNFYF